MTIEYDYKEYAKGRLRPVFPIEIINPTTGKSIKYSVLADTGSDGCLFETAIGELLGFQFGKPTRTVANPITGESSDRHEREVVLKVDSDPYAAVVSFTPSIETENYGIAGNLGLFDHFSATFDYGTGTFSLTRKLKWD